MPRPPGESGRHGMIGKDAFILPACSDMQHFGQVKAYKG